MKTTVEIPDSLLEEARRVAAREGTTIRALIEAGLRRVVAERRRPGGGFKLRDASFRGQGMKPPFHEDQWDDIREASYEGRGG
jgi:hypothetical protein